MTSKGVEFLALPSLVLRVGVTGHRALEASDDGIKALEQSIARIFSTFDESIRTAQSAVDKFSGEPASLRILNGLAEGADQLAAEQALALGHNLEVILPFSKDQFLEDFTNPGVGQRFQTLLSAADAVVQLGNERTSDRSEGFQGVGEWLCRNSDFLIACWDGKPARGAGGTAWVVEHALQQQVPVVWVEPQETACRIRLLIPVPTGTQVVKSEEWLHKLSSLVADTLMPPDAARDDQREASQRLHGYLTEQPKSVNLALVYPLFQWLAMGRTLRHSDWYPGQIPDELEQGDQLGWHLGHADQQANYYAQVYRGAMVINYLFASMAVLMALMGLLLPVLKSAWVAIELLLIVAVLANTTYGRHRNWHQRWLDYRQLAERCRVLNMLHPLGAMNLDELRWNRRLNRNQPTAWVDWLVSALVRARAAPPEPLQSSRLGEIRSSLTDHLQSQVGYHQLTADNAHRADHRLHVLGEIFLYGTILACLAYLGLGVLVETVPDLAKKWVTFITALLPAFGAAAFGLRAHADFRGIEDRSRATAMHLDDIHQRLNGLSPDYLALLRGADLIRKAHYEELRDWRVTFEQRPLAVPA